MKYEKSCGAIIYRKTNKNLEFLAIKSKTPDAYWGFPKGHVEDGETEEDTCRREVYEEVGLKISLDKGFKVKDTYKISKQIVKEVVFFTGSSLSSEVPIPQVEEVEDYKWATFDEIYDLLTFDSSKNVLIDAKKFLEKTL